VLPDSVTIARDEAAWEPEFKRVEAQRDALAMHQARAAVAGPLDGPHGR
jgi:hypothetical protein